MDYFQLIVFIILIIVFIKHYNRNISIILFTFYFPVEEQHHSIKSYIKWSYTYFKKVESNVVYFTITKFKNFTPKSKNIRSFFYNNLTSIPIIRSLKINTIVKNQLLQIYHSKLALLYYVTTRFKADFYFYNDISTFHFRSLEIIKEYPNPYYIKSLFGNTHNPILFTVSSDKYSKDFIQGGCFGGKKEAIKYLFNNYYSYLNTYYKSYGDINKSDEKIYNIIIFNLTNIILLPNNPNNCYPYTIGENHWFFYLSVLSGYPFECIKNITLKHINEF